MEREEKGDRPSSEQRPSTAHSTAPLSIRIGTASSSSSSTATSCRCPCHTAPVSAATGPTSAALSPRSPTHPHAQQPHSTLSTPHSPTAAHTKRQKPDTTAATTTVTPRSTAAAAHSSRPASGRSTGGRQLHIHTPLNTDTAIYKGAMALSPIPTRHTPTTPHDNKYDHDHHHTTAHPITTPHTTKQPSAAAADTVRREKLTAAYEAAQLKRAQQVRVDDSYYADMLHRQYERRVKMDYFRHQFDQHRQQQRLAEGKVGDRGGVIGGRPAFVDYGGRNTRPTVESERLLSFNILPDLPPNIPAQPQSYNSARRAAVERLRQKQLVVERVRGQLEEEGVSEAVDGESEYDRRVAALAQRQRVQQQQQHHAQRMTAAATHKPQRSSRPSTAERSVAAGSSSGSAYAPLLPLPIEPMASASQTSYASFRPPSSQSVKMQRQRY